MKKLFFLLPLFAFASCIKVEADPADPIDPNLAIGDYVCDCTYVSGNLDPNKVEETKLPSRTRMDATVDCDKLQSKYDIQFYSGTCILK